MLTTVLLIVSQININCQVTRSYAHKELTVGDPFEMALSIEYPAGTEISEPFVDSIEPFVILDQQSTMVEEKGRVKSTYTMRMASFAPGEISVPRFKFLHTHADTIDTLSSDTLRITIASVLPEDMNDINDIKNAIEYPNYLPLIIVGIVIACGLLVFAGYKYYKRWRTMRHRAQPEIPPWLEAHAAIDSIPLKEWIKKGLIKRYYYTLSEILKWYLERRFVFNAAEQTTTELITTLKVLKVPMRKEFDNFFTRADLVKYAKLIPPHDELVSAAQRAKDLVDHTKPTPQEGNS